MEQKLFWKGFYAVGRADMHWNAAVKGDYVVIAANDANGNVQHVRMSAQMAFDIAEKIMRVLKP